MAPKRTTNISARRASTPLPNTPDPPFFTDAHAALYERRNRLPAGSVAHAYRARLSGEAQQVLQDLFLNPPTVSDRGDIIWPAEEDDFDWENAELVWSKPFCAPPPKSSGTQTSSAWSTRAPGATPEFPWGKTSTGVPIVECGGPVSKFDPIPGNAEPIAQGPVRRKNTTGPHVMRCYAEPSTQRTPTAPGSYPKSAAASSLERSNAMRRPSSKSGTQGTAGVSGVHRSGAIRKTTNPVAQKQKSPPGTSVASRTRARAGKAASPGKRRV